MANGSNAVTVKAGSAAKLASRMVPVITQKQLKTLLSLKMEIDTEKRRLKQAEETAEQIETEIIKMLDGKGLVETGELSTGIDTKERVNVKWKEVVAQQLGPAFVEKVTKETAPTIYRKLWIGARVGTEGKR